MLFFENDYGYGAHPKVLEHLMETNMEAVSGYGNDKFTASAAEKIKKACSCPEGQVYFLTGGTQTNMVVIDTLLRPYEGVVASSCGHVNTHEAGAIESTGHKVLTVPHKNGKLDADDLRDYVQTFYADASHDHMVFPGMVYISHPSEYGTVYTKNELERISAVCHEFDMPLFLDGARLGYGLASDTDVTLADIARLTDVFYIGGTKNGAMFGEALVITRPELTDGFFRMKKRMGAVMEKGWIQGVMFQALFTDDLYFHMARHANEMAARLQDGLRAKGWTLWVDSPTNQVFAVVDNALKPQLDAVCDYEDWCPYDGSHTVVRFVTCFQTSQEDVDGLLAALPDLH